jgi:Trp operon repressor
MNQLKSLMQKEMSRKEFLATLGFGVATIIGLSSLLNMLGKENPWKSDSLGYNSGSYGGNKRNSL